jgi:hypothetical protein
VWVLLAVVLALFLAMPAFAQAVPAPTNPAVGDAVDRALGQLGGQAAGNTGQSGSLSLSLQVLIIMGLLTILPGILLMMTSFTRIIIVLAILRQALGLQQTPPNQVLLGLSLFLSFFIMAPTISQINTTATRVHGQADADQGCHDVRANRQVRALRDADGHPLLGAAARVRHVRTEDCVPDRVSDLPPVHRHRPGRRDRADVARHGDVEPDDHLDAVQAAAVRAGRRLGADHG